MYVYILRQTGGAGCCYPYFTNNETLVYYGIELLKSFWHLEATDDPEDPEPFGLGADVVPGLQIVPWADHFRKFTRQTVQAIAAIVNN